MVAKRMNNQPVVASHRVCQCCARRYGINLNFVLWESGGRLLTDELKAIRITHLTKRMAWEGEPAKEPAEKMKTPGLQSVAFVLRDNTQENDDFMSLMELNVAVERAYPRHCIL